MVSQVCDQYFDRFRRRCHVTPKSYLSFLTGYKGLYTEKLAYVSNLRDRMKTGLEKLAEAEESVNELSIELEQKEKDLAVASAQADEVLKEVTAKAGEANKIKESVQVGFPRDPIIRKSFEKSWNFSQTIENIFYFSEPFLFWLEA